MFFLKTKITIQTEYEIGTCSRMGSGAPHVIEHDTVDSFKEEIRNIHILFCGLIKKCYDAVIKDLVNMGQDAHEYNGIRILCTIKGVLNGASINERIEKMQDFFNFADKYLQIPMDENIKILLECGKYDIENFLLFYPRTEASKSFNYCALV
ncbi:hypothetical protein [Legionella brunensis]|uniref:Uncharacterized protein n=1 Tax=Legionella brunensis TaxID=29422 RepID=A0A0W0SEA3_9GAMM|nr:hypothetical protein [Legionella brunensis]KTC81499.1 hypothetical protein Lbru_2019 [Legionella brunensis]